MNTTLTPNQTDIIMQIGDSQAVIYVAFVVGPEQIDYNSNALFKNALAAGLKRARLEPSLQDGFYYGRFSVFCIVVEWEQRGAFIANLKETISELKILPHCTCALGDADKNLNIVFGDVPLGGRFHEAFLCPEYLDAFILEMEARKQRSKAWLEAQTKIYEEEKRKYEARQSEESDSK